MYISLGDVVALFLLGLLCMHFLAAVRVRELAVQAVGRASARDDFQLLDQSVHMRRISLSRDDNGRWRIWRQYRFDYSYDGVERRQVVGMAAAALKLRLARSAREAAAPSAAASHSGKKLRTGCW